MSTTAAAARVPGPGLRERKKARTRASIQAHALRLFRAQGYDATTIEQITEAAEVSETTLFRYFPTKESLVLSDDYDPRLVEAFQAQPEDAAPLRAMRAAFHEVFGGLSAEERESQRERVALILAVPALRAGLLGQFADAMRLLAGAFAGRTGRRPDDFAVRTIAGAVMGVMFAVLEELAEDPGADIAELIDTAMAQLEGGLAG
ncbi:MAG: TetR family transcriptional regulator [Catenulispora sp. 13_1_20CM_3_70_7]|nr:MAG: TetR family transcriptional regulator [Catenulispora sp. 13_1_20CM_3_70_7]